MVEGLADGSWALISKIHHCMVDGISGTDLMAVVLDASPDGSAAVDDTWRPEPEPSDAALVRDAVAEAMASPDEIGRWAKSAWRRPKRVIDEVGEFIDGAKALGAQLRPNVELPIEGAIGPHRRWARTSTTLETVKMIRAAHGGTVNDVVLAAITSGFRDLLLGRDVALDGVVIRTLVPVSVRTHDDHSYNNQVSAMIAELPVGIADPIERLHAIRAQMAGLKESHQAVAGSVLVDLAGFAPPVLMSVGLRTAMSVMRRLPQRSVNSVTTNVPGPQMPLYACGREMLEYVPFVPISHGMRTGVAILSYNRKVAFGVTGDWDSVPDLEVLSEGIARGIDDLVAASTPRAAPSRPRKRRAG